MTPLVKLFIEIRNSILSCMYDVPMVIVPLRNLYANLHETLTILLINNINTIINLNHIHQ